MRSLNNFNNNSDLPHPFGPFNIILFVFCLLHLEGEEAFSSCVKFEDKVCYALREYCAKSKDAVYILLDFCQLQDVEKSIIEALASIARLDFPILHIVMALSSGEGLDIDSSCEAEIHRLVGKRITIRGFSEKEARNYLNIMGCSDKFDHVKLHCGFNPLLLSTWANKRYVLNWQLLKKAKIGLTNMPLLTKMGCKFLLCSYQKWKLKPTIISNMDRYINSKQVWPYLVMLG